MQRHVQEITHISPRLVSSVETWKFQEYSKVNHPQHTRHVLIHLYFHSCEKIQLLLFIVRLFFGEITRKTSIHIIHIVKIHMKMHFFPSDSSIEDFFNFFFVNLDV